LKISGGDHADRLAPQERRRALRLGLVNAEIWSAAYAMTIVALVVYLAIDLGATGKALSFLLAAPSPPDREKSPYVAASDALGSVCHAAATIAGGFLFDWLADAKAMERLDGRASFRTWRCLRWRWRRGCWQCPWRRRSTNGAPGAGAASCGANRLRPAL
jgi:hypothetical protein